MAVEWVRLQLDLKAFDDADFLPYLRRCQQPGNAAAIGMNRRLGFVSDDR